MTYDVQRASARFVTQGKGWVGHYCFSYDGHYDAGNVSFGRMLACNEFVLDPGAGFGLHRHAGVDIVTTVLEGVLTHVTPERSEEHGPGSYVLPTGEGIEHDERNDAQQAVRFVQTWVLPGEGSALPRVLTPGAAEQLGPGRWFLFVADGTAVLDGTTMGRGDSGRLEGPARLTAGPASHVLAWEC